MPIILLGFEKWVRSRVFCFEQMPAGNGPAVAEWHAGREKRWGAVWGLKRMAFGEPWVQSQQLR